jgi:hypothetical protein
LAQDGDQALIDGVHGEAEMAHDIDRIGTPARLF